VADQTRAESLLAEIKAGADFASLAKKESLDVMSGKQGGDLGWISRGQLVPEFETAAFMLNKKDSLSGPIKTQYGYHLIQYMGNKAAKQPLLSEIHDQVREQYTQYVAEGKLTEQREQLEKLAFEQPDTLAPLVALGFTLEETPFIAQGDRKYHALLSAAFSEEVLIKRKNSHVIAVPQEGAFIVLRVQAHRPAVQLAFEAVQERVKVALAREKAQEKAKSLSEELVALLKAGDDTKVQKFVTDHHLTWVQKTATRAQQVSGVDREIIEQVFKLSKDHLPSIKSTGVSSGDYVVLSLNTVEQGRMDKLAPELQKNYQQGITDTIGRTEYALYVDGVKKHAKIELSPVHQE
jgi:peptidyl-prolyl cis-trans isomerase D